MSDLQFIIWKHAILGLSNEEIAQKIFDDKELNLKYPNNTAESVSAILSKLRSLYKNVIPVPKGWQGRPPVENLLSILDLKSQRIPARVIAERLFQDINIELAVRKIEVLHAKYRKRGYQYIKEQLSNKEIAYKLFPQLVKHSESNLKNATKIIERWRDMYNKSIIKMPQSKK